MLPLTLVSNRHGSFQSSPCFQRGAIGSGLAHGNEQAPIGSAGDYGLGGELARWSPMMPEGPRPGNTFWDVEARIGLR